MRYFLLLLLIPFGLTSQETTSIPLEIINKGIENVDKNSRLEVGFSLPEPTLREIARYLYSRPHNRTGLNPFVSWDVDAKASFIHSETGEKSESIAFWFTEIKRNTQLNQWEELNTLHPFRARFAPTKTGEWKTFVEVKIKGNLLFVSDTLTFNVVDSEYGGFVEVNSQTQYLERDGKMIIPTGINLPYPANFNNLIYSHDKNASLNLKAWENFDEFLDEYIEKGGEYFRFFLHPSSADIEFEEVGNYQKRQGFAWEIDKMIEKCEKNNVLIQFNMLYHQIFMKIGDYHQLKYDYSDYWYDKSVAPYRDVNEISGYSRILDSKTPSDMFINPIGIKYLKERARYIMARWGYSTSITMFELASEPWHVNEDSYNGTTPYNDISEEGDTSRRAAYEYHREISNYIKDTLNYKNHLLAAVGSFPAGPNRIFSNFNENQVAYSDSTWFLKNIDVISLSYYSKSPRKALISKTGRNNDCSRGENSMACVIQRLNETYGKPVLFGESDHGDGIHMCSNYETLKLDATRYPFTGAVGHFVWATFLYSLDDFGNVKKDERISWADIIRTKDFFNNPWFTDFLKSKPLQGRQKTHYRDKKAEILENQYFVNTQDNEAVGYVYNRTYNISTISKTNNYPKLSECSINDEQVDFTEPTVIPWTPQRVYVDGLRPWTKYKVTFYSYHSMTPYFSDVYSSNLAGKLRLEHPDLVPAYYGNPLFFYRVEKLKKTN